MHIYFCFNNNGNNSNNNASTAVKATQQQTEEAKTKYTGEWNVPTQGDRIVQ